MINDMSAGYIWTIIIVLGVVGAAMGSVNAIVAIVQSM